MCCHVEVLCVVNIRVRSWQFLCFVGFELGHKQVLCVAGFVLGHDKLSVLQALCEVMTHSLCCIICVLSYTSSLCC